MPKDSRGIAELRSEVNALKRQVGELTKTNPPRPEDMVGRQAMSGEKPDFLRVRQGNADYGTPVKQDIERLKGRSRSALTPDDERGAGSPLTGRRRK